ncbi:MAG: TIGR04086 family membrane protein [Clostridia bacterium]|nr:TIGR04086 family membrane protein [Clostridia bacterium]
MRNDGYSYGNVFFTIIKGVLLSLAISFLLAVSFAAILRATVLPDSVIYPVNQTLKALAIAVGALTFVRGARGWLQGGAIGLLTTALSYLAFSAIGGDFSLSWLILVELIIALSVGTLSGIVAVNFRG